MIAAHEQQAQINHGQSLAQLAERGGLSAHEAVSVLTSRSWYVVQVEGAEAELERLVEAWCSDQESP